VRAAAGVGEGRPAGGSASPTGQGLS
jgi:hypothetical protein